MATSTYTPVASPLPPPPNEDVFSPDQWSTLLAIGDTIIPSISTTTSSYSSAKSFLLSSLEDPSSDDSSRLIDSYLAENPSSIPQFKDALKALFGRYIHNEGRKGLTLVLTALNTRAGSLFLTGSPTPFHAQPFPVREAILHRWSHSYIPPVRGLYRSLTALFKKSWIQLSPTICPVLGFPQVPVHGEQNDGYNYSFLQFPAGEETITLDTDVVIIGSGCGGGVTAKNLAEAGHRVLVVEKAYHYPAKHFPMAQTEACTHLFESGGANLTDDGSMAVLSGSTWGGGGTINWSASLQTQNMVRQEWAKGGLPFFTSSAFQNSLDRVCERMGVNTDIDHNYANRLILEGSRKLGYGVKDVPQNTGHCKHDCGYCTLGCASSVKQGPAVTFLADSAKAGANFIEGFHAEKVLFKQVNGKKVATGVKGVWTSRDEHLRPEGTRGPKRNIVINAKKVVVSCGSLQSPLLLLRSGLKNPQIGRNLHLHPVAVSAAVFKDDIRPWEGGILTTVVNEFQDLDGQFHGTKIESLVMLPSFFLPLFPWKDGLDYKKFVTNLRHMNGYISLTRDRDPGRVYPDPVDGRIRIQYTPSAFDRKHMLEGLVGSAKIAYISGAQEIHTSSSDVPSFIRKDDPQASDAEEGINNADFQEWLKTFQRKGLSPEKTAFASAHQMGSCRMGNNPKKSVVDPNSKVWGTEGLYVVDASVFPSASGVNPMVTNMAISDWTSQNISKELKREQSVGRPRL
ncbi:hypothetical protein FQN54_001326 [Arachnomyces sp. PD_36]|nr:hypothetical protein FQN54_001326 [Arachnomyces sp. PD_36]